MSDPSKLFKNVRHVQDVSAEDYHGASYERLSRSRLGAFMEDPQKWYQKYVTREFVEDDDSPALRFGRVFHEVILEYRDTVNVNNFQKGTLAVFRAAERPAEAPDIVTKREAIWVKQHPVPTIFRESKLWGDLSEDRCWVYAPESNDNRLIVGSCALQDMHLDGISFRHIPECVLASGNRKMGKQWEMFAEQYEGEILYRPYEANEGWYRLLSMRRRLRSHRDAYNCIFSGGLVEQTFVAECAFTGLTVQFRSDMLKVYDEHVLVPDLKSAWKMNMFERDAINKRYYVQATMLKGAIQQVFDRHVDVVFVAQDKNPSFMPTTHEFHDGWIELGMRDYQKQVTQFKRCLDTWQWESPGFGERNTIAIPDWRIKQEMDKEYQEAYGW